jgi:DNA-binding NarL/FixJ family response regulator
MIKILIADEEANIRRGLRMRLNVEVDFFVVGETGDGWEALQLTRELQPEVVLTSSHISGMDGFSLTKRIHDDFPYCHVIVLSLYDEPANRERALQAGAYAFVSKQKPDDELIEAIRLASSKK